MYWAGRSKILISWLLKAGMVGCEYCMRADDVADLCSGKIAVVALGYIFHSEPRVDVVEAMPISKLDRHKKGEYGWEFVDGVYIQGHRQKHRQKSDIAREMLRMCRAYGVCNSFCEPANSLHEERIIAANELTQSLMSLPDTNSVYLTGSTALTSDRPDSDLDLLVILNSCPGERMHMEIEGRGDRYPFPVEFYFIEEKDFLKLAGSGYSLIENRILLSPGAAQHTRISHNVGRAPAT